MDELSLVELMCRVFFTYFHQKRENGLLLLFTNRGCKNSIYHTYKYKNIEIYDHKWYEINTTIRKIMGGMRCLLLLK